MHSSTRRRNSGSMLAEALAALAAIFPIIATAIFIAIECGHAYVIARAMDEGAYRAARALSVQYQFDPNCNTDGTQTQIFDSIRIPNMIASSSQFTITSWNTTPVAPNPKTVTVQVQYLPGQGTPALPPFPNPDPLHLTNLKIVGQATYALQ